MGYTGVELAKANEKLAYGKRACFSATPCLALTRQRK